MIHTSSITVASQSITLCLYSLSGKTSYRKISWSIEAARFGFKLFQSLWNLAGTSAALLPRCLSNFRAIQPLQHPISRLRHFTRFGGKTSYRLVNRGPDCLCSGFPLGFWCDADLYVMSWSGVLGTMSSSLLLLLLLFVLVQTSYQLTSSKYCITKFSII